MNKVGGSVVTVGAVWYLWPVGGHRLPAHSTTHTLANATLILLTAHLVHTYEDYPHTHKCHIAFNYWITPKKLLATHILNNAKLIPL